MVGLYINGYWFLDECLEKIGRIEEIKNRKLNTNRYFNCIMILEQLTAVSPLDGRYRNKIAQLSNYFSEYALIKYRIKVEVDYFDALCKIPLIQLKEVTNNQLELVQKIVENFCLQDAQAIKDTEKVTNHDVKAVEYFIKQQFEKLGLEAFKEFIHFGLTSQDVNNTAVPLSIKHFLNDVYYNDLQNLIDVIKDLSVKWASVPMLARTHGQPASPTFLGKELKVFWQRLNNQLQQLKKIPIMAKFGGATGNFNAHFAAYPNIDWHHFADNFVEKTLGLERCYPTTQIEHYDNMAALFDNCKRINTILIDFCRDVWSYISIDYFKQKIKAGEVGSSAMPHKVNPIDFENAEGNLGVANSLFMHLAEKLPISRLQRDLTDSTVSRNIGVPFAHTIIAFKSIIKGTSKLILNETKLHQDLEQNWAVIAEAIQNVLRRENYPQPYEALKQLTRTNSEINQQLMHNFIDELDISDSIKIELKAITPFNYTGK